MKRPNSTSRPTQEHNLPATDVRCQSRCTRSMDRRRRVALFNNQNVFWSVCRTASNSVLINLRICHRQPSQWQLATCRSSYACLYICCCSSFIRRQLNHGEARAARGGHSLTDEKTKSKALMAEATMVSLPHSMLSPLLAWLLAVKSLFWFTQKQPLLHTKETARPGLQVPW
jgi:hypothetical protein